MPETSATMLTGGHHNSLGRTSEVVDLVVDDASRLDELFGCLELDDELVRLRAGDALEKVCRERPELFVPRVDQVLDEMAAVDQPSVQWHVAQILGHVRAELSPSQERRAIELVQRQLTESTDWIVLNTAMDVFTDWARGDHELTDWLVPQLERLTGDERKSVAKRASKRLTQLRPS